MPEKRRMTVHMPHLALANIDGVTGMQVEVTLGTRGRQPHLTARASRLLVDVEEPTPFMTPPVKLANKTIPGTDGTVASLANRAKASNAPTRLGVIRVSV